MRDAEIDNVTRFTDVGRALEAINDIEGVEMGTNVNFGDIDRWGGRTKISLTLYVMHDTDGEVSD